MEASLHNCIFKWVFYLLIPSILASTSNADGFDRYVYSSLSCSDLIPRYESTIASIKGAKLTKVPVPTTKLLIVGNTTGMPTSLGLASPGLGISLSITTSTNNFYAPRRELQVTISTLDPIEGFMIQARKLDTEVVGTFVSASKMTVIINCKGDAPDNTAIDNDKPVLINNATFTWRAPINSVGGIVMRVSVVKGDQYQIHEQLLLPSTLPPQDKSKCGVSQSCFRLCPSRLINCKFTSSLLSAVISNSSDDSSVVIFLGAKMDLMKNYAAIGFTKDRVMLSEMDLNICYKTELNEIKIAHMYLENSREKPLPHQGAINLEATYVDGPTFWCSFSRPLFGNDLSRLNFEEPLYFFFLTGHHYKEEFELPRPRNMIRTRQLINQLKGMPINMVIYESNGKTRLKDSFVVVILANIFFELRFLYFI